MAVFQGITGFFLPSQRRSRAGGGGSPKVDQATQRILEGIDGVLEPFNAPDHLTDYLKSDLETAFDIKGPLRSVYEPGRVAPIKFNLVDFVNDPLTTTWKTVKTPFDSKFSDLLYTPDNFMTDVDKAVWKYLYEEVWVDNDHKPVVPASLKATVAGWNESKTKGKPRILRDLAAQGVRANPGMIMMQARRIESFYTPPPGTTYDKKAIDKQKKFKALGDQAEKYEADIGKSLVEAGDLKKRGDELAGRRQIKEARWFWSEADKGWDEADNKRKEWTKESKDAREEVTYEFKSLSRRGGPLYNSPEAQFSRFWEARNKHYATLQFLRTYREDRFWGVAKWYGWKAFTGKAKDVYYATRLNDALNAVAGKIGVKKLLGKLVDLQTFTKRLRAGFWVKKWMKNIGLKLIEKLGLGELIGGTLGSAVPILGTTVGAIIGAVVQFVGEIVVEKLGGAGKILAYVVAGVVGFFVLFSIAIITIISAVLSNKPYPWEAIATEVDCNQTATATSSCVLSKEAVKSVADNWGVGTGNHVNECYNDVIARTKAAGLDPRVAMATWLNESNASNYEMYERLGEPPQDFGVPAQAGNGFSAQISSFLTFYKQSRSTYSACYQGVGDAEGFFRTFCTAGRGEFGVGSCPNLTDQGKKCVAKYLNVYSFVNAGGTCN